MSTKRTAISIIAAVCSTTIAQAQFAVIDSAQIAQSATHQAAEIAKYVQMIEHQLTQLTHLTSQLEQLRQHNQAFGDPSSVVNLSGAEPLFSALRASEENQPLQALRRSASGQGALVSDGGGMYPPIAGTSPSGIPIQREAVGYKPFEAFENAQENYETVQESVRTRRTALRAQIADTVAAIQNSATDAETQKLQGVLGGQLAQLHSCEQELADARFQTNLQESANRNDQLKQQRAHAESIATDHHDAVLKCGSMLRPDVSSSLRFGRSHSN